MIWSLGAEVMIQPNFRARERVGTKIAEDQRSTNSRIRGLITMRECALTVVGEPVVVVLGPDYLLAA